MTSPKTYAVGDGPDLFTTDLYTTDLLAATKIAVRGLPYSLMIRFLLLAVGFMPVTLIAISCFGVPLKNLAICLMLPGVIAVALLAVLLPWVRRLVLGALAAGPVATLLYDSFRGCFNASGLINRDPIPHIGIALGLHWHGLAPGLSPGWVCGYTWRYMLNGTGLALAFSALGLRGLRAGIAFGLFVVSGLMVVLLISPYGQKTLWQITPWTVVMGVGGHIIYGGVVGTIRARMTAPPPSLQPDDSHRRSTGSQRRHRKSGTRSMPEPWPVFDFPDGPGLRDRVAEPAEELQETHRAQREIQAGFGAVDDRPRVPSRQPRRGSG
ncbi:MAG TPA: hypothetical protein VHV82_05260 [Sporichthyaceae bacterium]|jgi:hypothetical protein|nr:hypothetical protein [Sporichthyaceae bacterium]